MTRVLVGTKMAGVVVSDGPLRGLGVWDGMRWLFVTDVVVLQSPA